MTPLESYHPFDVIPPPPTHTQNALYLSTMGFTVCTHARTPFSTTHLLPIKEGAGILSGLQSCCYRLQEVAKEREDLFAKAQKSSKASPGARLDWE